MIVLKDIGKFEELPEIAMHIYKGNIPALQEAITAGWDIEDGIVLSKYTTVSPLDLALISQRMDVVKLLVEHGVNLNVHHNPAFCERCGTARKISFVISQHRAPSWINSIKPGQAHMHRPITAIKKTSRSFMSWD